MEELLLKTGDIAAFFNVSHKAIRIYDKMGIIKPFKVDEKTGYRYYTVDQVHQLNSLLDLKKLGFSLDEIKKIFAGNFDNDMFMEMLAHKKIAWQESIAIAENKIDSIDKIISRLSKSKEATKLHELTEEKRAWLLVKMVCIEDIQGQNILSEALWL